MEAKTSLLLHRLCLRNRQIKSIITYKGSLQGVTFAKPHYTNVLLQAYSSCHHMGSMLVPHWFHMGPHWFHMGSTWVPYGFHIGSTLVPYGLHIGSIWVPHWFHIGSTWVSHWFHVGSTWVLYGFQQMFMLARNL